MRKASSEKRALLHAKKQFYFLQNAFEKGIFKRSQEVKPLAGLGRAQKKEKHNSQFPAEDQIESYGGSCSDGIGLNRLTKQAGSLRFFA